MTGPNQMWCLEKAELAIEKGAPHAAKILLNGSNTEAHATITRECFEQEFGPNSDSTKEAILKADSNLEKAPQSD